jgi:glycosyltransferase involved in cell wall biosynthesis
MKVLNIVKYYHPSVGGMETYIRQLCSGMRKNGIEASAIAIDNIRGKKTKWEIIDTVPVRRVASQLNLLSQPISLSFGREMGKLISDTDIIHLNCPFPNAEIFHNSFKLKPLIVTWHADPVKTRWGKIFPLFRPFLIRILDMAQKIILTGPILFENSPTLQNYQNKCDVIPLAYSHTKQNSLFQTFKKLTTEKPTILFVGKLRKYKGVEYLIHAIHDLPNVGLRIVGNGEELSNLKQITNKLGINSRVTFLGYVPNEHLPVEYENADIFVLPSIDGSEAFGIVQAEAMSYGLPVINTALPSNVPFVSLNGVTGLTVPPSDSAALTSAIKKLCDEPIFYEKCSRNALQRAKLFTEENMIEKYAEVYRKCI